MLPAALFRMRALTGSMLSTILAALPSHSSTSDCAAHLNDSSKSNKLCQPCAYSSEWKRQRVTLRSAHLRILDRVQKSLEFSMNPHPSAVAGYLGMLTKFLHTAFGCQNAPLSNLLLKDQAGDNFLNSCMSEKLYSILVLT